MRPHAWAVVPDPDAVAIELHEANPSRRAWPLPEHASSDRPMGDFGDKPFWVVCRGCGALIMTEEKLFPDRCHVGWKMPADCDEALVERIMKE